MQEDQNRSLRKLFGQLTGASLLVTGPAFGLPQGFPQVVDGQTTLCHIVFDYFRGSNPEKRGYRDCLGHIVKLIELVPRTPLSRRLHRRG
jgi:hypothetical protein